MAARGSRLYDHQIWVDVFVLLNFAALVGDIYLAHSENHFRRPAESIPLYFSLAAPLVLAAALALKERWELVAAWRDLGYLVGWVSVAIGLAGVILHLESQFFYERTLRSLTYAAPFAAPLAYAGLGLLLIVNRMVRPDTLEWAQWVLLLTVGGFFGNFVFSLTDHAMNGFFRPAEWIPVVTSAFAVSFLTVIFFVPVTRRFLRLCGAVLGVQALVGVVGFALHASADMRQAAPTLFEKISAGAPPMAPLLFPNLVILGLMALWVLAGHLPGPRDPSDS